MKLLNSASFQRLESGVKAAELRNTILSNNIANAETPGFKRSEILFEELLEQQIGQHSTVKLAGKRTDSKHIPIGKSTLSNPAPKLTTEDQTFMNNNGNNVDQEREMSLLAKNQMAYNYYIGQINHDVSMMRLAIEGR
ncbi:flagellar basal body rod protein FlgB [Paenibacillus sp. NPDC058071]|uniref:flagellar basal body rod protein FlgB n=1 Tax=Paenibacillus sp. NPDC058071 TaxID=3346326 RepID=UPI0036DF4EC0